MRKISSFFALTGLLLMLSMAILPQATVFADVADGTYEIDYEIKEAGGGSTSIADGYFSKPAELTVKDGVEYIQITLTSSDMIKSLSVQGTPVDVVSDSGDTRVVKFEVSDTSQPVDMEMHVVVPDLYDTTHGATAVFDVSDIPAKAASEEPTENEKVAPEPDQAKSEEVTMESDEPGFEEGTTDPDQKDDEVAGAVDGEDNPPTGDSTPVALYAMLLLASGVGIFMIVRTRVARN